jgi:transposase
MVSFSSTLRYFLYRPPTDMRKGIDSLSGLVRGAMGGDPLSGEVFIFINRRRNQMKLLVWDRTGFVLFHKRLERGTFELPGSPEAGASVVLGWEELVMILEGVRLSSVRRRKRYCREKTAA